MSARRTVVRPAKPDLIVVSDDEENEPAAKRPFPSRKVIRLEEKVAKLESDLKGAIRIAGESQARVEYLEKLIDVKPNVGNAADANQVIDLQKRLADTSKELDKIRKEVATDIADKKLIEDLKNNLAETSKQLEEANRKGAKREEELQNMIKFPEHRSEERKLEASAHSERERVRLAVVLAQLKDATGKEEKVAEKELEMAQEIAALKMDKVELRREILDMYNDVPELQERVSSLTAQLAQEQQRARVRIDELSKQLAQCGLGRQQLMGSAAIPAARVAVRVSAGADRQQPQPRGAAGGGPLAGFGMSPAARQLYEGLMDTSGNLV